MERLTKTYSDGTHGAADNLPCGENSYTYKGLLLKALGKYEDAEEQGLLLKLPCKVGDMVYVDSSSLPIEDMEEFETEDEMPPYFKARVVSFRIAKRSWIKVAVLAKWLYEWIDDETGPESSYYETEKYFSYPLSSIGKTVFITQKEAEQKLKEVGKNEQSI